MLKIYIDADSLPVQLRAIILRRIIREELAAWFVADRPLKDVNSAIAEHTALLRRQKREGGVVDQTALRAIKSQIVMVVVAPGDDSADDWIVEHAATPALAITHDIPLASRLVERGITVLDDRGGIYTEENIAQRLSVRNIMGEFREMGIYAERHRPMDSRQVKAFSDAFDATLTKLLKQAEPDHPFEV
jgi:uncharacterized protein YaiI (UPF0178 family)